MLKYNHFEHHDLCVLQVLRGIVTKRQLLVQTKKNQKKKKSIKINLQKSPHRRSCIISHSGGVPFPLARECAAEKQDTQQSRSLVRKIIALLQYTSMR